MTKTISIIGAGAWGTAVALHLARKGHRILIWVYEEELCRAMKNGRSNTFYLPLHTLPDNVDVTTDIFDVIDFSQDIIVSTPSFALRETIEPAARMLRDKRILILTKGIETKSLFRMSQVVTDVIGSRDVTVASLSGPSFADEVASQAFTSVVVASERRELSTYFQETIHADNFRVYATNDLTGVELGGSLKNVMAIGAGIIEGLQMGTNTRAAFVTRAIAEMKRLGRALGARETTFMGLSGIGDLILTSYGQLSRNRRFGAELAEGRDPGEIIAGQKNVVEGYYTTKAVYTLSRNLGVDMPISEELYKILYEGKRIDDSIQGIKTRALKEEDE